MSLQNHQKPSRRAAYLVRLLLLLGAVGARAQSRTEAPLLGPSPASNLRLTAPIDRWDEAIPVGNGLTGGLLWGSGNVLRLSLDRGDLWDQRIPEMLQRPDWTWATMQKLVAANDHKTLVEMFDRPYDEIPYPTKLPVGRLEMVFPDDWRFESFELDLPTATATARAAQGYVTVIFSATQPIAAIRVHGTAPKLRLLAPEGARKLGYPPARHGHATSETTIGVLSKRTIRTTSIRFAQPTLGKLQYGCVASTQTLSDGALIVAAIGATHDGGDPVEAVQSSLHSAHEAGYEKLLAEHAAWWSAFWQRSGVRIPDAAIQQQYDLTRYFYGAASRRGAPPIPLQGVWTADEGGLPPWKGDYHHDLNTQLTYWPYLNAGHFEEGAAFLDFLWDLRPVFREFAASFYSAPGIAIPGVMTLDGKPMGGWGMYSLSPTNGAWLAQAFHLHWRYTGDETFLRTRAYPWCRDVGLCLKSLLRPAADGKLRLPLSSSPEIHDNSLKAWLRPNSNYDLALLHWLFAALAEMAEAGAAPAEAGDWRAVLGALDELHVEGDAGVLRVSADESLTESHRHFSHLMAIHPLGLISVEGSDRERRVIDASLAQLDRLGTRAWTGYSFSWLACMQARAGRGAAAARSLTRFVDAFCARNGFHLNGDFKDRGLSDLKYRPFTLEGNFAAGQAVHEMLLQSWGGVVRVFPALPAEWGSVAFDDLRAEGGLRVCARRDGGRTEWVRVVPERTERVRLRDPFDGAGAWTPVPVATASGILSFDATAGAPIIGRRAR